MTQSNSKLIKGQKADLKAFKKAKPKAVFAASGRVTVCLRRTGTHTAVMSTAISSVDEKKIRRKVGEYYAACRMSSGYSVPVGIDGYSELEDMAYQLAYYMDMLAE